MSLSEVKIRARVKYICAENPKLSERRRMVQLYEGKLCKGQDVGERVASYTYGTGPIV